MNYSAELEGVKAEVERLYQNYPNESLVYHNFAHTERVVQKAGELGNHYKLNEKDFFILLSAAWFHDVGYLFDAANHEEAGAEVAGRFLSSLGSSTDIIDSVKSAIISTKIPQAGANLVEQILGDADLFHLGTKEFKGLNKSVRKEYSLLYPQEYSKEKWLIKTIAFLESHRYQTDFANDILNKQKQKNIETLKSRLTGNNSEVQEDAKIVKSINHAPVKEKEEKPSRGIETMFRISSANHQRLSDMADNKAHIIITVNSIILSAILSFLIRKIDSELYLAWPTALIMLVSLSAIIFAILSTRPSITKGTFSQQEVDEKKANLLFFGNFHKMSFESYSAAMLVAMNDKEYLYQMLIKDLYSQGAVLGKKYRLLRISYNIFMYGLVAAVFAFLIASLLFA
ncbi:Pycsar system effector family protein [Desertivirga brevis]|uniref:Pycsar system effector family protein n=2 Tax=Desertivirga brevis TaxID=2810310 RepID=UPI001A97A4B2|nr:Pycsar system effector family protein [Pedobacter sp. SYSU D00873]